MPSLEPHTLSTSSLSLSLLPYGLTFSSLLVALPGSVSSQRDILIGPADLSEHVTNRRFLNQTVGRYANRLPSGTVPVLNGDVKLELVTNEGKDVCLHGGSKGIDTVDWELVSSGSDSKLFDPSSSASSTSAIYRHVSPAGSDGYPCTLFIEALVALSEPDGEDEEDVVGRVVVELRAKIEDGEATPVNLTVHWGFNLGSFDESEKEDMLDHEMCIKADRTPELAPNMLATGKVLTLASDDPLNFTTSRKIGSNFHPNGVDHNLIFSNITAMTPQVILTSPDGRLSLEFKTTETSVQCYTAAGFDGTSPAKKLIHDKLKERKRYPKFGAAFLEFHQPLATFLHDEMKRIVGHDGILRKGQVYRNWCEVTVKAK